MTARSPFTGFLGRSQRPFSGKKKITREKPALMPSALCRLARQHLSPCWLRSRCPRKGRLWAPPAQGSWRPTTSGGLITECRSHATRSAGAKKSVESGRSCPRNGEYLTRWEYPARRSRSKLLRSSGNWSRGRV